MAEVTIYTSPTCIHCKAAKAYMNENSISYEEKDVVSDPEARKWVTDRGYRGVPVIVVGEQEMLGFDPQELDKMLGR